MNITDYNVLEGLILADTLLNLNENHKEDIREICEQCVYFLYGDKL